MREFDGRVAVVTGGASGIGRALARAFTGEGMVVVLADIRAGRFVSMIGLEHAAQTLAQRAKRIGSGELPQAPSRGMMI